MRSSILTPDFLRRSRVSQRLTRRHRGAGQTSRHAELLEAFLKLIVPVYHRTVRFACSTGHETTVCRRQSVPLDALDRVVSPSSSPVMQPHDVEGLKPDPDDNKNRKRRRTTVLLLAIIAGLLAAITINLMGRF
jgi:hypothetical protein